ncbi:response regulator, partial [bacterium]|nr:response regulator [bacterium]
MSQSGQFRNRLILVIEDEPRMLDLVRITLEGAGFVVSGALSGQEGLAKLRDEIPDLVVLDLMLPGTDGITLCRELRSPGAPPLPIIMLTARSDEADRILGL